MSNYSRELFLSPSGRHLSPDPGHSKCNAETDKKHITPSASKDNVLTFLIFLSPAYISLHERPARAAKFVKNRRSPRQPGKDRPKLVKTSSFLTKTSPLLAGARGVAKPFTLTVVGTIYTRIAALGDPFISFHSFNRDGPQHKPAPSELAGTHAAISNAFSAATVS